MQGLTLGAHVSPRGTWGRPSAETPREAPGAADHSHEMEGTARSTVLGSRARVFGEDGGRAGDPASDPATSGLALC